MSRYPALEATRVGLLLFAVSCSGTIGDPGSPSSEGPSDGPIIPIEPVEPPPPVPACTDPGLKPAFMPTLRITSKQYGNVIRDLFEDRITPSNLFPSTTDREGFSTHPEANIVSLLAAEDIMRAAEEIRDLGADLYRSDSSVCELGEPDLRAVFHQYFRQARLSTAAHSRGTR
ncbi:MAG: DUF1587 domain-containing protein [Myxococcota bacterium]